MVKSSTNYIDYVKGVFFTSKYEFYNLLNWDVTHLGIQFTDKCMSNIGEIYNLVPHESCAASWTYNNIIYFSTEEHLEKVMEFYKIQIDKKGFIRETILRELSHEAYRKILLDSEIDMWVLKAKKYQFHKEYTEYIAEDFYDVFNEEYFCDYIVYCIVNNCIPRDLIRR